MNLCPVCGPDGAPRPTGVQTFTYSGVTHKTKECAAISSLGEQSVRTADGYAAASGLLVCLDCFDYGKQHTYTDERDLQQQHDQRSDLRRRHDIGEPRRRY